MLYFVFLSHKLAWFADKRISVVPDFYFQINYNFYVTNLSTAHWDLSKRFEAGWVHTFPYILINFLETSDYEEEDQPVLCCDKNFGARTNRMFIPVT